MIERIVENWLDSATEKEFQIPFCHVLAREGKTVVHMTRHCSMEMGKDIIAVDSKGNPYVYQLKAMNGKKLSLKHWDNNLLPQMDKLILQSIEHPNIKADKTHRSFLVINGEVDEEATAAIRQYNQGLQNRGFSSKQCLELIVKGQLYTKFMEMGTDLWPFAETEYRILLELYLEFGNGCFPKDKLATLLGDMLPRKKIVGRGKDNVSKASCQRKLTSAAILTSLASTSFSRQQNHVAVFESWTIYVSYALSLADRHNLEKKYWLHEIQLGFDSMYNSLFRLCEETIQRKTLKEGNPISDFVFRQTRITHIAGLLSLLGLWRIHLGLPHDEIDEHIHDFVNKHINNLQLWGEYAVPQFLSIYFYMDITDSTTRPTRYLRNLFSGIVHLAQYQKGHQLPDPYCNPEEYFLETMCRSQQERRHNFQDGSYAIEALMHLYVRSNNKQTMKHIWPDVTRVQFKKFTPDVLCDYYRWFIEEGVTDSIFLHPTKEWEELKKESNEHSGTEIPALMKEYPIFYLAFLCTYPHRINASGIRWLHTSLIKSSS